MHLFIWLDGLAGAGVLLLALWCLFGLRPSPADPQAGEGLGPDRLPKGEGP